MWVKSTSSRNSFSTISLEIMRSEPQNSVSKNQFSKQLVSMKQRERHSKIGKNGYPCWSQENVKRIETLKVNSPDFLCVCWIFLSLFFYLSTFQSQFRIVLFIHRVELVWNCCFFLFQIHSNRIQYNQRMLCPIDSDTFISQFTTHLMILVCVCQSNRMIANRMWVKENGERMKK